MELRYTAKERQRRKEAQAVIDDKTQPFNVRETAYRTLDRLEAKATRRAKEKAARKPEQPSKPAWMEGYTPTPAQQAVIDRLLEEGNDHEAQVWFLVYQMEADPIARKAMEAANQ